MSTPSANLEATAARLVEDVEDGFFCTGAQAFVVHRGQVLLDSGFGCDGLGRPLTADTVSAVYCAIKPMYAVLVLLAEQEGLLRREMELGELLAVDDNPALAAVRLDDLLSHRAGMHLLRSLELGVMPPAVRLRQAMKAKPAERWDRRRDGAYSEWLGFFLVGQVLEQAYGAQLPVLLRERLLEPLGIASAVSLGISTDDRRRIGVNVRMQAGRPLPLLMERVPWFAEATDPSLSAYATMRGLCRFYEWVLATLNGDQTLLDTDRLRDACRPQRPVVHDPILDVEADWGLGFMTGLKRLGFGPYVSSRAVGHTGQVGTSMAFCDPEHDLAAAVLYNGVIDQATGIRIRRPAIVGAIYRDLGLAPPSHM